MQIDSENQQHSVIFNVPGAPQIVFHLSPFEMTKLLSLVVNNYESSTLIKPQHSVRRYLGPIEVPFGDQSDAQPEPVPDTQTSSQINQWTSDKMPVNCFRHDDVMQLVNLYGSFEFHDMAHMEESLMAKIQQLSDIYLIKWTPRDRYVKITCKYKGCPFKIWYDYKYLDLKDQRPCRITRHVSKVTYHATPSHNRGKTKV